MKNGSLENKKIKIIPTFKLWMEADGKPVVGEGKARLLLEIYNTGSLSQAAEKLGISYRHAHEMISSLNERCGMDIVITRVGGPDGGGTEITGAGIKLIEDYLALKNSVQKILDEHISGE